MTDDQIPYYFDAIDRNAIIVKPKKPFFDWLNFIYKEEKIKPEKDENNVYLIREMISNEDIKKWMKKNFDQIFINELNDWHTDEENWPQNRTFKIFEEWFSLEINSMVLDLEDEPIFKE